MFCTSRRTHIFTEGRLLNTNNRRKISQNDVQYLPALYSLSLEETDPNVSLSRVAQNNLDS